MHSSEELERDDVFATGPEGVAGRLQAGALVADGMEGVVGALIVVVGLGNWLGGPGGNPKYGWIDRNRTCQNEKINLSYLILHHDFYITINDLS